MCGNFTSQPSHVRLSFTRTASGFRRSRCFGKRARLSENRTPTRKTARVLLCQTQAMTHATELAPLTENLFRAVAKERGISFEEVVALYPDPSEELLEELEDEVDIAAMNRARLESDSNERYTLDDLRAAMAERRK